MFLICEYNQYIKEKMYKPMQSASSSIIENKFILKSLMTFISQYQLVTHIVHHIRISLSNNFGLTTILNLHST